MIKKSEHLNEGLENLRSMIQKHSPFKGMTKRQILDELRRSRAQLWKERIETRSRHK